MAGSKELAINSTWSPEFIQELLPSAERTALLYHLSFLCLGGFPKLERLIRKQALDTQMLFGSSEAVLLKCVGTSDNLVSSLFPMLIKAIEMKKPTLAVRYLEKARTWIDDIIRAVKDTVMRYEQQSQNVDSCTSDVFEEKKETEKKVTQHSMEVKKLEDAVAKMEEELRKTAQSKQEIERKQQEKSYELQNSYVYYQPRFYYLFVYYSKYYYSGYKATAKTQALNAELSYLASEKSSLINTEWNTQIKLTDLQLQLASSKIQQGEIPSPVHLKDVQQCLSRIRQILIDLQKLWEKVGAMLDTLKDRTFVGEDLIEDQDMKAEFVNFIKAAEMYWQKFGECCLRAQHIFRLQSKDAYKFLETDPSSLSEAERNNQYQFIMGRLQQITSQASATPALTKF